METECRELCGAEDLLQSFPLHRACRDGDLSTLVGLLGEAVMSLCDAAAQDPLFGWTPAHWAAHNGKVECLEMLVKAGLPCDIATHGTGLTLAHVAALEGQTTCLTWVCENGVSINAQDHMGETAAHKAVRCGSVECLHILREHGANLSLRSSIGITVMELAVQNQQTPCIEYFKAGGDSHMTHHMTCRNGRRKRMQALEEAEIDMDPAKRARVEGEEFHHGISHPSRQQLNRMTIKENQDIINHTGVVSGVGSVEHASQLSSYVCSPKASLGKGTCTTIAGHHTYDTINGSSDVNSHGTINGFTEIDQELAQDYATVVPCCQPVFSRRPLHSEDYRPSDREADMVIDEAKEYSNGYRVNGDSGKSGYNMGVLSPEKSGGSCVHTMSNGAMEHNEMVQHSIGYDTTLEAMYSYDSPLCGHAY